jgi:branched-subunit amino acid aminotransferase/4-amino-4-deoxychorismate lyase
VGCDAGRPLLWPWHRERLAATLTRLGAPENVRLPDEEAIRELLKADGLKGPARVRVVARAGIESEWSVVAAAVGCLETGLEVGPARLVLERWSGKPALAAHKMLNREKWDLARERAEQEGADDALLVDAEGHVLETSSANIWIRHGSVVLTPPAPERCHPGIMRRWLIERGGDLGTAVRECDLKVADVAVADEVLMSNSVHGFRRVSRVVDRRWWEWPLYERLAETGVPAPGWANQRTP